MSSNDLLWNRFPESVPSGVNCDAVWDQIGVFGHTPVNGYGAVAPIKQGKLRLIDTGAFQGDYLTAYCCEQDDWVLESTDSRDIK